MTVQQNQLKWRCRRGVLELDVLLEKFWRIEGDPLPEGLSEQLHALLQEEDPFLLAWLVQGATPPEQHRAIVSRLLAQKSM